MAATTRRRVAASVEAQSRASLGAHCVEKAPSSTKSPLTRASSAPAV